jgi:hypothetical protein
MLSGYLLRIELGLPARFAGSCTVRRIGDIQPQHAALERAAASGEIRVFRLDGVHTGRWLLGRGLFFVRLFTGRGTMARGGVRLNIGGKEHRRTSGRKRRSRVVRKRTTQAHMVLDALRTPLRNGEGQMCRVSAAEPGN